MTMLPLHVLPELVEVAVTFSHSYFFSPDDHIYRGDLLSVLMVPVFSE